MRHDVAIYVTSSATSGFYDRAHGRAGGAERQMTLLAQAIAEGGRRVAHITYEPRDPVPLPPSLTLVYRAPYRGDRRLVGSPLEALAVWRALGRADARTLVLRTASPMLAVAAAYCRLRRRKLVFSSSNISDFTLEKMTGLRERWLYGVGMRAADAVVVQSDDQVALAASTFPTLRRVVRIPSLAEPAPDPAPQSAGDASFLWFGRAVPQKHPGRYVELARALPDAAFRMIVTPGGPGTQLLDELRADAAEVPNLDLLEPMPHHELQGLIAGSVAVVNTSSLEGMPNAFLEAWACRVPVLTLEFDPDGVVESRALGIAARGSWERFVAGARELWESRSDRAELSERVRRHVDEIHAPAAVASRWEALLDQLQSGPEARRASGNRN